MTSECSHCWLPRTKVIRGEAWKSLGIFWHTKTVRCKTQRVRASQRRWANLLENQEQSSERTSRAEGVGVSIPHILATETPVEQCRSVNLLILFGIHHCGAFASHTSWCSEGNECRTFHPRRSTGLWQGSTQRRPSRTRCSDGGGPGRCRCLSPRTAVAVRIRRGGSHLR